MSVERRLTRAGSVRYLARVKNAGHHVAARTFGRKADAEAWAREQYRALAFGDFIPPARSATRFAEVVSGFVESRRGQVSPHTLRTDSDNLASAVAAWGSRPLSSVGASEILTFLTDQLAIKARSTVQRSRTSLSALFAYAVREKMLMRNPVTGVRLPPGKHQESERLDAFTDAELADVLARQYQINSRMAEVTEFLSLTGLRWSELRALRVADLQPAPFPAIRVVRAQSDGYPEKGTKTYRGRVVPLTARALEIAAPRVDDRSPGEYLFTSATGVQLRGDVFRRTVKRHEGAPGRTIHDMRHYPASHWLRAGVPVHQVAKWLGHANPSTTLKVYAHVLGEAQDMAAVAHLRDGPGSLSALGEFDQLADSTVAVPPDHEAGQIGWVEFVHLTQRVEVTERVSLAGCVVPTVVAVPVDALVQLDRFRRQRGLEGLLGVEVDGSIVPSPSPQIIGAPLDHEGVGTMRWHRRQSVE